MCTIRFTPVKESMNAHSVTKGSSAMQSWNYTNGYIQARLLTNVVFVIRHLQLDIIYAHIKHGFMKRSRHTSVAIVTNYSFQWWNYVIIGVYTLENALINATSVERHLKNHRHWGFIKEFIRPTKVLTVIFVVNILRWRMRWKYMQICTGTTRMNATFVVECSTVPCIWRSIKVGCIQIVCHRISAISAKKVFNWNQVWNDMKVAILPIWEIILAKNAKDNLKHNDLLIIIKERTKERNTSVINVTKSFIWKLA